MNATLLEVDSLRVIYKQKGGGILEAVGGIGFNIQNGGSLALIGESGCGKTTTARAVAQLLKPTAGIVRFQGVDLAALAGENLQYARRGMQMIFQDPDGSLDPRWTVAESIAEPVFHLNKKARAALAEQLLISVGLDAEFASRRPHALSGGQKQRVAIARALASNPRLLILDEPTSALDVSVRAQIVNLLCDLRESRGMAFLLITHDLAVARVLADEIAVMRAGRIIEFGPSEEILQNARDPHTRSLVSASEFHLQ
ncbi:MAG: ABC transporter ATP-binding protein [Planctomycetes bacterium]|nr:ABC transporter ATP-binding protein [Planctomycetota bacterium]